MIILEIYLGYLTWQLCIEYELAATVNLVFKVVLYDTRSLRTFSEKN